MRLPLARKARAVRGQVPVSLVAAAWAALGERSGPAQRLPGKTSFSTGWGNSGRRKFRKRFAGRATITQPLIPPPPSSATHPRPPVGDVLCRDQQWDASDSEAASGGACSRELRPRPQARPGCPAPPLSIQGEAFQWRPFRLRRCPLRSRALRTPLCRQSVARPPKA
jgi:hypothetical protein